MDKEASQIRVGLEKDRKMKHRKARVKMNVEGDNVSLKTGKEKQLNRMNKRDTVTGPS